MQARKSTIKITTVMIFCLLMNGKVFSQKNQTWFFLSHTQQLTDKFDLLADAQLRSMDRMDYISTLLLRGALSYNFNKKHAIALGYAYKGDWDRAETAGQHTFENRVYQQYQYQFKLKKAEMVLRSRFEQRFLQDNGQQFSMRARAFFSLQIPLVADTDFTKGLYTGLQNEVFLNVYHKQAVNNHLLDQNRPYVSLGYRFSKHIDTSFDYGLMTDVEDDYTATDNVYRISLTTSF